MTLYFLLNTLYESVKDYIDPSQIIFLTLIGASSYYTVKLCHAIDFQKSNPYISQYLEDNNNIDSSREIVSSDNEHSDTNLSDDPILPKESESRITHYSEDDTDSDILSQIAELEKQIETLQNRLNRLRMMYEINCSSEDSEDDSEEELHVKYNEESSESPKIQFDTNRNIFNNGFDLASLSNTMKLVQALTNSNNKSLFNSEKAFRILAKRFAVEPTSEMLELWNSIIESEEVKRMINNPWKLFQDTMSNNSTTGNIIRDMILNNPSLREKSEALEKIIRTQSKISLKLDHQTFNEILNEYFMFR